VELRDWRKPQKMLDLSYDAFPGLCRHGVAAVLYLRAAAVGVGSGVAAIYTDQQRRSLQDVIA